MRAPLTVLAAICLLLASCSSSKPKTYPVSGTVRWNDEPMKHGHILFHPLDGGVPHPGEIHEGTYKLRASAGKMKVEIRATREEGDVNPTMGARPRVQYIPDKYNDRTTLEAEVTPDGENRFDFPLKDKP